MSIIEKYLLNRQIYNDQNVNVAVKKAETVQPVPGGGTEILPSLRYIYAQPMAPSTQRIIFILTDGEVYNIQECKDEVAAQQNTTRVFSFGIGHGASTDLVRSLARISGGMSEMVLHDQDQLSPKVIAMLDAATMADTSDISFQWTADNNELKMTTPQRISLQAFNGRAIGQYAVYKRNRTLGGSVRLLGNINGQFTDFEENFTIARNTFSPNNSPLPLHYLAAKSKLIELADQYHISSDLTVKESLRMEAERLSVESGVVCSFTALVAVDTSGHVVQGTPIHVGIPRGTVYSTSMPGAVTAVPRLPPPGPMACVAQCIAARSSFLMAPSPANFSKISGLQNVEGSWKLSDEFINSLGTVNIPTRSDAIETVKQIIKEALPSGHGIRSINRKTVATIVSISYFRHHRLMQGQMIERKAVGFLTQQNGFTNEYVEAILTKAMELIIFIY